jgi:hypothetical protein
LKYQPTCSSDFSVGGPNNFPASRSEIASFKVPVLRRTLASAMTLVFSGLPTTTAATYGRRIATTDLVLVIASSATRSAYFSLVRAKLSSS